MASDVASLTDGVRRAEDEVAGVVAQSRAATRGLDHLSGAHARISAAVEIIERVVSVEQQLGAAESAHRLGDDVRAAALLGRVRGTLSALGAPAAAADAATVSPAVTERALALDGDLRAGLGARIARDVAAWDAEATREGLRALSSLPPPGGEPPGPAGDSPHATRVLCDALRAALERPAPGVLDPATATPSHDAAGPVAAYWEALLSETRRAAGLVAKAAPGEVPSVVLEALGGACRASQPAVGAAIAGAVEAAGQAGGRAAAVGALAAVVAEAGAFVRGLPTAAGVREGEGGGAGAEGYLDALLAAMLPVLKAVKGYPALERAALLAEAAAAAGRIGRGDAEGLAGGFRDGLRAVAAACRGAAERCAAATGMTEAQGLAQAADQGMSDFLGRTGQVLSRAQPVMAGSPEVCAPAALRVVAEVAAVEGELESLSASLRAARRDALLLLAERARPSVSLSDMGLFGLAMRVNPKFDAKVRALVDGDDDAAELLPRAGRAARALLARAEEVACSVVLAQVSGHAAAVPGLTAWAAAGDGGAGAFSAYPQTWATAVGEHLLSLPQMLEASGGGEGGTGPGLLPRLASEGAGLAVAPCLRVERLTPPGARQMAADLEYLTSVLSALGVAPPAPLQALVGLSAAAAAGAGVGSEAAKWKGEAPEVVDAFVRMLQ